MHISVRYASWPCICGHPGVHDVWKHLGIGLLPAERCTFATLAEPHQCLELPAMLLGGQAGRLPGGLPVGPVPRKLSRRLGAPEAIRSRGSYLLWGEDDLV